MPTQLIVWICTALALVVVVVTRVRLHAGTVGGQRPVNRLTLDGHTVVGLLAVVLWATFLLAPEGSWAGGAGLGIVAVGCWWVCAALGIALLTRWLPARGRHSGDAAAEAPTGGLVLSLLGHLGMLAVTLWFTWLYLVSAV